MLKDLFLSMDDDGSGLLEEPEIKQLAIALGQKLSHNEAMAGISQFPTVWYSAAYFGLFFPGLG